jgi:hypothetical protein
VAALLVVASLAELVFGWDIPPGPAVVILAVVAAVLPLVRGEMSAKEKAVWTLAFFAVAVVEIVALKRDREKSQHQFTEQQAQRTAEFRQVMDRFTELQATTLSAIQSANRLAAAPQFPAANLKRRALALADEIMRFLVDREKDAPWQQGPEVAVHTDPAVIVNWMNSIVLDYQQKFAAQVQEIRDELLQAGHTSERLDRFARTAINPRSIRIVAEELGALAEKVPDNVHR